MAWLALLGTWLRESSNVAVRHAAALGALALAFYGIIAAWIVVSGRLTPDSVAVGLLGADLTWYLQVTAPRYHYVPPLLLAIATARLVPSCAGLRPR